MISCTWTRNLELLSLFFFLSILIRIVRNTQGYHTVIISKISFNSDGSVLENFIALISKKCACIKLVNINMKHNILITLYDEKITQK